MPRLLFAKTGNAVWISHLDLMRVFQRAFRRGGILIRHSQGFAPGPMSPSPCPFPWARRACASFWTSIWRRG